VVDDPTFAGRAHARIPHAKDAKVAKGVIFNFGFFIFSRVRGTHSRADSSHKGRKVPNKIQEYCF